MIEKGKRDKKGHGRVIQGVGDVDGCIDHPT
jgi:hypothetical protein